MRAVYAFVDESGDPGLDVPSGASRYFTVAVVVVDSIESLREARIKLDPAAHSKIRREWHFHSDGHRRRIDALRRVQGLKFRWATVVVDKLSYGMSSHKPPGSQLHSDTLLAALGDSSLNDATVVIDGPRDRRARRLIVPQALGDTSSGRRVRRIAMRPSHSEPMLQVADYVAAIAQRIATDPPRAAPYDRYLARHRSSLRVLPGIEGVESARP